MNSKNKSEKPKAVMPDVEILELIGDEIKTGKFLEELFWFNDPKSPHFSLTEFPQSTCESPTDWLK